MTLPPEICPFFFFNDTATTEIYTLSLHDALPILDFGGMLNPICGAMLDAQRIGKQADRQAKGQKDRKSTRLNSSHQIISYAVFCLKKKKRSNTKSPVRTARYVPDRAQRST